MTVGHQTSTTTATNRSNWTIAGGLAGGVGAFLLTYMVIFLVKINSVGDVLGQIDMIGRIDSAPPQDWQVVGWLFFEAHNVGTTASASLGSQSETAAAGLLSSPLWESWFLVLPIAVLLLVGYVIGSIKTSWNPSSGFKAEASIALGYAVVTAIAVFVVAWRATVSAVVVNVGPDVVAGVVIAGIVYPVVVGGVGGVIAGVVDK